MSFFKKGFRVEFPGRTLAVITGVMVQQARAPVLGRGPARAPLSIRALWDTGAGISLVSKSLARRLGLVPIDTCRIAGVSGNMIADAYKITVTLPGKLTFSPLRVAEWNGARNYDMLIGMDIISRGDLCLRSSRGKTVFSFKA